MIYLDKEGYRRVKGLGGAEVPLTIVTCPRCGTKVNRKDPNNSDSVYTNSESWNRNQGEVCCPKCLEDWGEKLKTYKDEHPYTGKHRIINSLLHPYPKIPEELHLQYAFITYYIPIGYRLGSGVLSKILARRAEQKYEKIADAIAGIKNTWNSLDRDEEDRASSWVEYKTDDRKDLPIKKFHYVKYDKKGRIMKKEDDDRVRS